MSTTEVRDRLIEFVESHLFEPVDQNLLEEFIAEFDLFKQRARLLINPAQNQFYWDGSEESGSWIASFPDGTAWFMLEHGLSRILVTVTPSGVGDVDVAQGIPGPL